MVIFCKILCRQTSHIVSRYTAILQHHSIGISFVGLDIRTRSHVKVKGHMHRQSFDMIYMVSQTTAYSMKWGYVTNRILNCEHTFTSKISGSVWSSAVGVGEVVWVRGNRGIDETRPSLEVGITVAGEFRRWVNGRDIVPAPGEAAILEVEWK